jgi:hypothetical protein
MTPETLWKRYAAIWSLHADARMPELSLCLADGVTYCDPNGLIEGCAALSAYMGQFQASMPGGRFHIRWVLNHHDRSLAHWALLGSDGTIVQTGTSFSALSEDGRLKDITGFFHPAKEELPA